MSDKVRIVYFADSHLDLGAWVGRPELQGDSMAAFAYIIDFAIRHNAEAVVGAGDLIDVRKPPSRVIEFLRECLERLRKKQIPFYGIMGQHDLADPPWFKAVSSAHYSLHKNLQNISEVVHYGLDWTPPDELPDALAAIPKHASVLIAHQVWGEFMGDITLPEGHLVQVPYVSTIITGDFHQTVRQKLTATDGRPLTVISPGATHKRTIKEPDAHHFFVMDGGGKLVSYRIPTRPSFSVQFSDDDAKLAEFLARGPAQLKMPLSPALAKRLPQELHKPLLHVTIWEDMLPAWERIQKAFGDDVHLFRKVLRREEHTPEVIETRKENKRRIESGLEGCLELVAPKGSKLQKSLSRLLNSINVKAELAEMRKEHGL